MPGFILQPYVFEDVENIWFDDAGIKPFLAAWQASAMTIVQLPLGHFQQHDIF